MPRKIDRDRARGCLLGLAIGDALGAAQEFATPGEYPFLELVSGPHVDIIGGGPFEIPPYGTTDDTAMAACLAGSLVERSCFDVEDVAARYTRWAADAADVGNQTSDVLDRVRSGMPVAEAAAAVWHQKAPPPAGNGALMRTAPIGVAFALSPLEALAVAATDEAAITHWDPRCQLASAGFDAAIATALTSGTTLRPDDLLQAAFDIKPYAMLRILERDGESSAVVSAGGDIDNDLRAATANDPCLYAHDLHLHDHMGFVRVALRLAFWELFHAPTFEAALIDVVNRGGDSDTNGAITGALLGAYLGESAIPDRWVAPMIHAHASKNVESPTDLETLLALADQCAERGGL
jgi:ADP-ribosylglycohydrolase